MLKREGGKRKRGIERRNAAADAEKSGKEAKNPKAEIGKSGRNSAFCGCSFGPMNVVQCVGKLEIRWPDIDFSQSHNCSLNFFRFPPQTGR
jgi:hypothetical protein